MKKKIISFFLAFLLVLSGFSSPVHAEASFHRDLSSKDISSKGYNSNEIIRVIIQAKDKKAKNSLKGYVSKLQKASLKKDFDVVFDGFSADIKESDYYKLRLDNRVKNISKSKVFYPTMASAKKLGQIFEAQEKYKNSGEGMVISVIDSGLDLTHKDFQRLDNPKKAKIKNVMPYGGENQDTYFNLKVPYGYNFADNSYRVKGYASNHGIHVSGIAGANARDNELESFAGIDGVASQAQILAMTVFSNNSELKGAQEDDIISAIEKSIEKDADIINMSLGTASGFCNDNDPTAKAIEKARQKGILVVVAAGNDTAAFSSKQSNGVENFFGRKDVGLVGSPSTSKGALSVASFENTNTFVKKFEFKDGEEKINFSYSLDNGVNDGKPHKIEDAGLGKKEDFTGKDFKGKLALIKRGSITFSEKSKNAKDAGAIGAIIYNTDDVRTGYSISGLGDFPVFNILNSHGVKLLDAFKKNKDVEVLFSNKQVQDINANSGKMSNFSSLGTTSNLDFKPEITGVGGRIYSTDNDNSYVMMDGTSMAAPFVSGSSAIVYSQVKKDVKNVNNFADFTKKTMMNTAKILMNNDIDTKIPYTVRRQGSGLVQVKDAIENRVILSYENENGSACGELRSFIGQKTFKINLKNYSDNDLSFDVDVDRVYTTKTADNNLLEEVSPASITADKKEIKVPANSSTNLTVTIDASNVNDNFVEGFVKFISKDKNQPNIHFPYMGFAGDWNGENILDNLDTVENKDAITFGETKLISMIKDPKNIFDKGKLFALGLEIDKSDSNEKPSEQHWSISPNNDGFADVLIPQIGVLRSCESLEFNILDKDKKFIRKLDRQEFVRRQSYKDFKSRVESKQQFKVYPFVEGMWDGKLYNQKKGEFEAASDGQYYLEAVAKLGKNYGEQKRLFPVKIDTKRPKIELIKTKDGKDYEVTDKGRLLKFKVTDDVGISSFYGKVSKEKIKATKTNEGYEILIPFNVEMNESLKLVANDFALNETRTTINNIKGNSLAFTSWDSIVDKKIGFMGKDYSGSTSNKDTKFISIKFVNKKTNEEINSNDCKVINGKFAFASYTLTTKQQGKYNAYAIEKDANKTEIKRTSLGEFIYDYIAPTVSFNHCEVVKGDKVKNPLKNKSKNYQEYIMKKNPDGTATFTGKVSDNVFSAKELKLTIGSRENVVKINDDGSFNYTLKTPSKHFDFINVSQKIDSDSENSSLINGLDLATSKPIKKKGLERTYVINSYIDSDETMKEPEFKLTTATEVIINADTIGKNEAIKAEKVGEEYFYSINGFTNRKENTILLDGEEIFRKDTVDNGSYFEHKVKLNPGMNKFNLRILDKEYKILKEVKVRVILDTKLPDLILESPLTDGVEVVEVENKNAKSEKDKTIKEEYSLIKTWKDKVEFKGKISDDGTGYSLTINGDFVEASKSRSSFGDNEKEFSKEIQVEDNDIITLNIKDEFGNSKEFKFKVKKIEAPKIIEIEDINKTKEDGYVRVHIKNKEEKIYDVLLGKVSLKELLPNIEDTDDLKFDGWYSDEQLKNKEDNLDKNVEKDMTLYPKFSKKEKKPDTTPKAETPENGDANTKPETKPSLPSSPEPNIPSLPSVPVLPDLPTPVVPILPSITPSTPEQAQPKATTRIAGADRIHTAVEVSKKYYNKADTVIVANCEKFADSLSAAALSKALKAPILLVQKDELDSVVSQEIKRLGAKNVIVIGGKQSVDKTKDSLSRYNVQTIAGSDRYETSARIAQEIIKRTKTTQAVIASGETFADALTVAPLANKQNMPILLVQPNNIPKPTQEVMKQIKNVIIVGGENTISKELENKLPSPTRISGANRYETAKKIYEYGFKDRVEVNIANGTNFADSLVIGSIDCPILLAESNEIPKATKEAIKDSKFEKINIFGGENSIGESVVKELVK